MVSRSKNLPSPPKPALALTVSRSEAEEKIRNQIIKAQGITGATIHNRAALDEKKSELKAWKKYVILLLNNIFSNEEFSNEFSSVGYAPILFIGGRENSFYEDVDEFNKDCKLRIDCLESILNRLELIPEPPAKIAPLAKENSHVTVQNPSNRKVFIVHGHDEAAKSAAAAFLIAIDFEPIILHQQANRGDTVIEKFERHSEVGFAVVLLTPDDIGGKDENSLHRRARQNVVAELGYFIGKLGRGRVLPLMKGDIEIPSDFTGVVYTPMDDHGRWKTELAKELDAAGFDVDFKKAARS